MKIPKGLGDLQLKGNVEYAFKSLKSVDEIKNEFSDLYGKDNVVVENNIYYYKNVDNNCIISVNYGEGIFTDVYILEVKKSNNTSSEVFCGKTIEEWKEKIEEYYSINNLNDSYETIECYYNDKGEFVATVSTQYEVSAEYVFDEKTGYAKDIFTQDIIDFKNNKVIERASKTTIDFQESYVLAVGYVSDRSLNNFINSNFHDEKFYNSLDIYDYRENNKNEGYGNRFVIIPKSDAVKISLYTCKLGEDGRLKKDEVLIEDTDKAFIIYDEYIETMPRLILGYSYDGKGSEIPLIFDGVSGELLIEDNQVLNVSMY